MNLLRKEFHFINLVIILFISLLFSIKYTERIHDNYLLISTAYVIVILFSIVISRILNSDILTRFLSKTFPILFVIVAGFLLFQIPVETLRVDRWMMIDSFFKRLANFEYPYLPYPGQNIPGPFPVYFALMLPFYLIGEIGIQYIVSVMLLFLLSQKMNSDNDLLTIQLVLLLQVSLLWELVTRSTIFSVMVFGMAFLYFIHKKDEKYRYEPIIMGLLLSTRSIMIIPLLLYSVNHFRGKELSYMYKYLIVFGLTFILTFVPLAFIDEQLFFKVNPLTVQTGLIYGPLKYIIPLLALLMAVYWGWKTYDLRNQFRISGYILFFISFTSFLNNIYYNGWQDAFWESGFDISYFIFCLPFLTLTVLKKEE